MKSRFETDVDYLLVNTGDPSMSFPTNERYGYAVLNFLGDEDKIERMPANKKIVFHRVTRNKRTYCNGTDVMNSELHATCPIDRLPPCKRCYHY